MEPIFLRKPRKMSKMRSLVTSLNHTTYYFFLNLIVRLIVILNMNANIKISFKFSDNI